MKRTRSQKKEHALKIRKYKRKDDQKDLLEEYKILAARIKANITRSIFVFEAYGGVFSPLRTIVVFLTLVNMSRFKVQVIIKDG